MNYSISTMTGKNKIKIVFLGNQSVGKSSIIEQYIHNKFEESSNPTVGIDFLAKNITYKSKNYRLQLWDTAGQQRFRSLIPSYLKDAHCALIIFDVTNALSLNNADMWLKLYNDNKTGQGFTFLIGNKIDLDYRSVNREEGIKKASELSIPYFQISAKTGENIQNLFDSLIDVCSEKTLSAGNFELKQRRIQKIIKQQKQDNEEKVQQSATKIQSQMVKQSTIVLKNQKIEIVKKKDNCC